MGDLLVTDLHIVHFGYRDRFVRGDTHQSGGHMRFHLECGRQCRIDGGDLRAGIEEERIRAGVVDGHLDDIEILRQMTRMYTGDVSRAMGRRLGGWQQEEKTCQSRPLDIEHWRSPRPFWRLGELLTRGSARS